MGRRMSVREAARLRRRGLLLTGLAGIAALVLSVRFGRYAALFVVGLTAAAMAIYLVVLRRLENMVNRTLEEIDDMVRGLIDGRPVSPFEENEDSLTGKFQTEMGRLYDILTSYEQRERAAKEELRSSVSDLVHQINTPIANLRLYAGFLLDEGISREERRHFAESICRQGEKLGWLGEGFSKLSRLETGLIEVKSEEQPVLPCLLEAIDQVALKAEQHGDTVVLEGEGKLRACFDRRWTQEAVFNLLDNAVKYGNENSEIVVRQQEYELYVRIDVGNEGPSIPESERALVFRRFYRGKAAEAQEGVGLGLYLVRLIVESERGYVKAGEDSEGRTVFSVFLPKPAPRTGNGK